MSERDGFLRAIAANPADDTVRLAFADWLEEHGDPDRAEFIRVQIQFGNADRTSPPPAKLAACEKHLLDAHRAEWLGPLANVVAEGDHEPFEPTFRRGFVESASIHGKVLGKYAEALREHCPALVELDVVGVRGHGRAIAAAECLETVRKLRLEDWPYPADAQAVANSPHLSRLESLSVWLGSRNDEAVCRSVAAPKQMPALRRVELIQLRGGMTAGVSAANLANVAYGHDREAIQCMTAGPAAAALVAHADRMAALVNTLCGSALATVDRPFDVLFPLADSIGRDLFAGTLPDGRQVYTYGGPRCDVLYFDPEGRLVGGERIDLSGALTRSPEPIWASYNQPEFVERLGERIGFRPGMIWVREFDAATVIPGHWLSVYKFGSTTQELFENPDGPQPVNFEDREGKLEHVRFFLRCSNFCITAGNECWADERGHIHST